MASAAEVLKQHTPVETVVKTVQLDGQVVLKIMQHCNSSLPNIVTGQLLGLDVGNMLEVTDCFPFPVRCFPPPLPSCLHGSASLASMLPSPQRQPRSHMHVICMSATSHLRRIASACTSKAIGAVPRACRQPPSLTPPRRMSRTRPPCTLSRTPEW